MYKCLAARLAIDTFVIGEDEKHGCYFSFSTWKKSSILFQKFLSSEE